MLFMGRLIAPLSATFRARPELIALGMLFPDARHVHELIAPGMLF